MRIRAYFSRKGIIVRHIYAFSFTYEKYVSKQIYTCGQKNAERALYWGNCMANMHYNGEIASQICIIMGILHGKHAL